MARLTYQDVISQKICDTSWHYGPMDHLDTLKENRGTTQERETTFRYNTKDQLIEEKKSLSQGPIRYFYDVGGNLCKVSFLDATGKKTKMEWECDRLGRVVKASSDAVSVERTYNLMQLIETETTRYDKKSYTVQYAYDNQGRLTSITLPDKSSIRYIYSPHDLKKVQRMANGKTYTHSYLSYDDQGNVVEEEMMHGQKRVSKYDLSRRKIESSTEVFSEKMEYDLLGNLISSQEKGYIGSQEKSYSYDNLSQLLSEKGFFSHFYGYDAMFNRISKDDKKYSFVSGILCVSSPEGTFSYDPVGNLIGRKTCGKETLFSYDGLNHLIEAKKEDKKVTYIYDAFGRRVSKTIDVGSTTKSISYIFVGDQEIGSFEGKKLQDLYVLGKDGKPVGIEISGKMYVPYLDNQDNIKALFSTSSSQICETYRYSAFGGEDILDAVGVSQSTSTLHNFWRFKGGRVEEELGLIFFHNRFYDPLLGRWITPDPMQWIDGPNLYAYVKNNPLKYTDLWGFSGRDNYYQGADFEEYFDHERHDPSYRPGEVYARIRSYEEESMPLFSSAEGWSAPFHLKTQEVPHGMIGFINGIETSRLSAYEHASFLSKLGQGSNIHGVYNATHGILSDLGESILSLLGVSSPRPVNLLQKQWRGFFDKEKKNPFLQICHSQGVLHVYNALLGMTPEERDRIIVVTVAPAKYITRKYCIKARNYVSKRDFVPLFDIMGRRNCQQGEVVVLEPHKDALLIDHNFESPTYTESISTEIKKYMHSLGE